MSKKSLGWNDILEKAELKYKEQVTEGFIRWPPACHNKDSKAAPAKFGANLSQIPLQNTPFHGNCHHCGKPGHRKSECPLLKNKFKGKGRSNQNSRKGFVMSASSSSTNPKQQPPSVLSTTSRSSRRKFKIANLNGVVTATAGLPLTIRPLTQVATRPPQPVEVVELIPILKQT